MSGVFVLVLNMVYSATLFFLFGKKNDNLHFDFIICKILTISTRDALIHALQVTQVIQCTMSRQQHIETQVLCRKLCVVRLQLLGKRMWRTFQRTPHTGVRTFAAFFWWSQFFGKIRTQINAEGNVRRTP